MSFSDRLENLEPPRGHSNSAMFWTAIGFGALGLLLGARAGANWIKARAVEYGMAYYDSQTGEFIWKDGGKKGESA